MNFKNSRFFEADGLQIKQVKYVIDILTTVIDIIFNVCFKYGVFPSLVQIAKVSVLHKKSDRHCLRNYRPVAVWPIVQRDLKKLYTIKCLVSAKT